MVLLDRERVLEQAGTSPELAMGLARVMGAQWRMAVRHLIDLKSRSAAERLTAILLRFADHQGGSGARLPFSKRTLAARLGVSRETLSRIIQVSAENGVVLRGSDILIRDRARAEAFSGPEPYINRSERRLNVFAF